VPTAGQLFTLSAWITPLWILSGAILGFKGLWDDGVSKKWLISYVGLTFLLVLTSWWSGAKQISLQQRQEDAQTRLESAQNEMNRRQDALNRFQQQLGQEQEQLSEKETAIAKQVGDIARLSAPKPIILPDVEMRLVGVRHPSPLLVNSSRDVAHDIKWSVELWNLDRPPSPPASAWNPLLIPVQMFDYIRPHESGGPQEIFNTPLVSNAVSVGNRLFGYGTVTCPNCVTTRCVWIYLVYGSSGWYSPLPSNAPFVDVKTVFKIIPLIAQDSEHYLNQIAKANSRIPIQDSP
jgi:hypothetical protein